jgi:uncharacterized protein (TIGR02266 family)
MGIERRRYPRIRVSFVVDYRGKSILQNAESYNLSKGGMFIATDKIEPPGTPIEVIFEFGKEYKRRIQAEAVVVWNREKSVLDEGGRSLPPGMGVQFKRIYPLDAEKFLEDLIQKWEER